MRTRIASAILVPVVIAFSSATLSAPTPYYPLPLPQPDRPDELIDQEFEGKYRKEVKTSITRDEDGEISIDWTPRTLGTMLDRLDRWDMNDSWMRDHYQWHHTVAATERVDEELQNVRVRGWLKAIKYEYGDGSQEGDNDYHLIISNYRYAHRNERFFTVEISGLPEDPGDDRDVIRSTREQIAEILGNVNLQRGRYYKPPSAIRVEVEGCLYFDGSHYPGQVGPSGMRPKTVWEMHPVTSIVVPE